MSGNLQEPENEDRELKQQFSLRLGKRLREVRESKQITQEELANRANIYRTYVGHIETGTYSPTVYTMSRLAKAMGIELAELLRDLD